MRNSNKSSKSLYGQNSWGPLRFALKMASRFILRDFGTEAVRKAEMGLSLALHSKAGT
jgi:hypothetical protein